MMRIFRAIADSVYLNLLSGLILLVSGGNEVIHSFSDGHIGAHHGVTLVGLIQIIQSLPHIVHGSEQITKVEEKIK